MRQDYVIYYRVDIQDRETGFWEHREIVPVHFVLEIVPHRFLWWRWTTSRLQRTPDAVKEARREAYQKAIQFRPPLSDAVVCIVERYAYWCYDCQAERQVERVVWRNGEWR